MKSVVLTIILGVFFTACATVPKDETVLEVRAVQNIQSATINLEDKEMLAQQYYKTGDYEKAYNAYQTLLIHMPKYHQHYRKTLLSFADSALGLHGHNDKFRQEAENIYERVLNNDETDQDTNIRARAGIVLIKFVEGSFENPAAALLSSINNTPNDMRLWNALGLAYDKNHEWINALEAYVQALKIANADDYNKASILNNMGMSLAMQSRTEEALVKFKQANQESPDVLIYDNNRRYAYLQLGRVDLALDGLKEQHSAQMYNDAGYYFQNRGDIETAKQLYKQAIKQSLTYFEVAEYNLTVLQESDALSSLDVQAIQK